MAAKVAQQSSETEENASPSNVLVRLFCSVEILMLFGQNCAETTGPFRLSELVSQLHVNHFANGMNQFHRQFLCHSLALKFKMGHSTLKMCHFVEFEESGLQIGTVQLRTDQSVRPVPEL